MKKIVVLDFGGQFAHLIATKIRSLGAYSEIWSNETPASCFDKNEIAGIIFSGGPKSVYLDESPKIDPEILNLNIPILGICYGHQLIAHNLGGEVHPAKVREYGKSFFKVEKFEGIFKDFAEESVMWMSHGDEVVCFPQGFERVGTTEDGEAAAMANFEKNIYGIQFHPEVSHSEKGMDLLFNFVKLCAVENTWKLDDYVDSIIKDIQNQVGDKNVFLMVSGGVDSSVCFALLEKALGKERVYGLLVDHGLMRKDEAKKVKNMLSQAGFENLHIADESDYFLSRLVNIFEPEKKRMIIGDSFLDVQEDVSESLKLDPDDWFLAQGTIYPDTIETGGTKHADKIKTHHNRVERIEKMIEEGKIVEPIKDLFKDEVRKVGLKLGLPEAMIKRRPFPGPGLGVRILCQKESEKLENHKEIEQLIYTKFGVENLILPIKSVGVQGDCRTYAHPLVLFGFYDFTVLEKLATDIPNQLRDINRVLYCVSHMEEELQELTLFNLDNAYLTEDRISKLQEADQIVNEILKTDLSIQKQEEIWQFPVVLAPIGFGAGESIILRPIHSENAMTANAVDLGYEILQKISDRIIAEVGGISAVFYDLTNKPPGTIEWE